MKGNFMNLYNTLNKSITSSARNRDERAREDSIKNLIADLIPDNLLNGMPWWQRRNRVDKPFDMFDGECEDEEDYF